jgi:hypothetical protein
MTNLGLETLEKIVAKAEHDIRHVRMAVVDNGPEFNAAVVDAHTAAGQGFGAGTQGARVQHLSARAAQSLIDAEQLLAALKRELMKTADVVDNARARERSWGPTLDI